MGWILPTGNLPYGTILGRDNHPPESPDTYDHQSIGEDSSITFIYTHDGVTDCTKIRVWITREDIDVLVGVDAETLYVQVYYGGAYHNLEWPDTTYGDWQELNLPSAQVVTEIRVMLTNINMETTFWGRVHEAQFWQKEGLPIPVAMHHYKQMRDN